MIAKAKSISHGINALNYISGVSANKKHPERIFHVCDNLLPPGIDPMGIWNSVKLASLSHPRMTKDMIRIEISPAKEHTVNFTMDDWHQLWRDFVAEFDGQELKGKGGRTVSPKTNIAGSIHTVYVHYESDSGTPHLHAAVSRVDCNGNINNDSNIHLRAQRAAERVARKRGWRSAANIHDANKTKVGKDCLDVLRDMKRWSLDDYFNGLHAKGYDVKVRKDDSGIIRGYVLRHGNAKFKASELGKGRNLMITKLEDTWKKLHPMAVQQSPQQTTPQTVKDKPDSDTTPDYTVDRPGTQRVELEHEGESYTRFIPEPVMQLFNEDFDDREFDNSIDLMNEACYLFAVAMSFMAALNVPTCTSGGGGGASDNDLPKKRDDLEEEIERARRCADAARAKIGAVRRRGFRR